MQAELKQAELQQVALSQAERPQAELPQAELPQAERPQAGLQQAERPQAELQQAELQQVELQQAGLQQVALSQAELPQAELSQAELQQAELQQAELQQAELPQAELPQAERPQAELQQAERPQAELQQAGLKQVELQQAGLQQVELQQATRGSLQQPDQRDALLRCVIAGTITCYSTGLGSTEVVQPAGNQATSLAAPHRGGGEGGGQGDPHLLDCLGERVKPTARPSDPANVATSTADNLGDLNGLLSSRVNGAPGTSPVVVFVSTDNSVTGAATHPGANAGVDLVVVPASGANSGNGLSASSIDCSATRPINVASVLAAPGPNSESIRKLLAAECGKVVKLFVELTKCRGSSTATTFLDMCGDVEGAVACYFFCPSLAPPMYGARSRKTAWGRYRTTGAARGSDAQCSYCGAQYSSGRDAKVRVRAVYPDGRFIDAKVLTFPRERDVYMGYCEPRQWFCFECWQHAADQRARTTGCPDRGIAPSCVLNDPRYAFIARLPLRDAERVLGATFTDKPESVAPSTHDVKRARISK